MHCQAYRNHDAWLARLPAVFLVHLQRPVCLCMRSRVHLCLCVCVGGRTHACVDQTCRSGGSTTSCCSSAHSRLRLKKRHQKAAAADVDSELVNAMISPAARRTPCDRFGYGCCHDSISPAQQQTSCKAHAAVSSLHLLFTFAVLLLKPVHS